MDPAYARILADLILCKSRKYSCCKLMITVATSGPKDYISQHPLNPPALISVCLPLPQLWLGEGEIQRSVKG